MGVQTRPHAVAVLTIGCYASVIFLGAVLLFQLEPMIAKAILPWFGGGANVWTVCLLFFQVVLLAGYAYSHLFTRVVSARLQPWVHIALLLLSLAALPILPAMHWRPTGAESPTWWILAILTCHIGAPFMVLSATGPLMQSWFVRDLPGRSPYRLFALSNAGSLLALMGYPVLMETVLPLSGQATLWTGCYVLFIALCAVVAIRRGCLPAHRPAQPTGDRSSAPRHDNPSFAKVASWIALSALGSVMLMATSNRLSQDIAAVPMLWIAPLATYLLTFVCCFERDGWYRRWLFGPTLLVMTAVVMYPIYYPTIVDIGWQVVVLLITLFLACMVCHGELAMSRPPSAQLTWFYLATGAGGAVGGMLVTLVAPAIFSGSWEYHLGLLATCVLASRQLWRSRPAHWPQRSATYTRWATIAVCLALAVTLTVECLNQRRASIDAARSFYGTVRIVNETDAVGRPLRVMLHGSTEHGAQYALPELAGMPTTYYGHGSGIATVVGSRSPWRQASPDDPFRVGVIGLGTGTIAGYGMPGDTFRFYEIDREVVRLARKYFDFTPPGVDVEYVLGDARVSLEREADAGERQRFDVLAIDAFTSDAVPVHLLTAQAFAVYLQHLEPDGVIAFHISNRYLELSGVIRGLAEAHGFDAVRVMREEEPALAIYGSEWVLVTRNRRPRTIDRLTRVATDWTRRDPTPVLWTDDHASIVPLIFARARRAIAAPVAAMHASRPAASGSSSGNPTPPSPPISR